MAASYKPEGYSTVSPYLIAAGAQAVIDFLKKAFGARELRRYDMPDGSIMHAEVRIGDTVVMVGDAGDNWPAVPAHLHVYVDSVDTIYERALAAGGVSVQPPRAQGRRSGSSGWCEGSRWQHMVDCHTGGAIGAVNFINGRVTRRFEFQKHCQLFVRTHNEELTVAAMCVNNPDCSPFTI